MKIKLIIIFSFLITTVNAQSIEFFTSGRLILGTHKERTASVGVGDIDNDGDADILVANGRHWPGQNRVFVNNVRGVFTVSKELCFEM